MTSEPTARTLDVPGAVLTYDIRKAASPACSAPASSRRVRWRIAPRSPSPTSPAPSP
jgi:hypothetical protein